MASTSQQTPAAGEQSGRAPAKPGFARFILKRIADDLRGVSKRKVSHRCVVLLTSGAETQAKLLGNFSGGLDVQFRVDYDLWRDANRKLRQSWPSTMLFDMKHTSDHSWSIEIPANFNIPKENRNKGGALIGDWQELISYPNGNVITIPRVSASEAAEGPAAMGIEALQRYLATSQNAQDKATIQELRENDRLCYIRIELERDHLQPSNTFLGECSEPEALEVREYLRHLARLPADTKLCFDVFFDMPREHGAHTMRPLEEAFEQFRSAIKYEHEEPDFFGKNWAKQAKQARVAANDVWKPVTERQPRYRPRSQLLYVADPWALIRRHSLDLHHQAAINALLRRVLEETPLVMFCLRLHGAADAPFAALVEIPSDLNVSMILTPGTRGTIAWQDNEDRKAWEFVVTPAKAVGRATDVFLHIYCRIKNSENRPEAVNLYEASANGTLDHRRQQGEACETVCLKVIADETTAAQHKKALEWVNTKISRKGKDMDSAEKVLRIMTGESLYDSGIALQQAETASCYEGTFVEYARADLDNINRRFAKAIDVPGATLSEEQLQFILDGPESAAPDKLYMCNGYAGTSKSTTVSVWLAFMIWHAMHHSETEWRKGVLFAKMHKTVDTSVEALNTIIEPFTGWKAIREFGDSTDLRLLTWIIGGMPDPQEMPTWAQGLGHSEATPEVIEAAGAIQESLRLSEGRSDCFLLHKYTAIWHIAQAMINADDQSAADLQQASASADTAEDYEAPQPGSSKRSRNPETEHTSRTAEEEQSALEIDPMDIEASTSLHSLIKKRLRDGWDVEEKKDAMTLLRSLKRNWMDRNAAVVCTTISLADSREVNDWNAHHVVLEESQYVDVHDALVILKSFVGKFIYMIGDRYQLAPFVGDATWNGFAGVRTVSFFEQELNRGRPHVVLRESRRADSRGLAMASRLCYNSELRSALPGTHRDHDKMQEFVRKYFLPADPISGRQLFINTAAGYEMKEGFSKSTANMTVVQHALTVVELLVREAFPPTSILVVAPYTLDGEMYRDELRMRFPNPKNRPAVGTTPAVMGRETQIAILSIPKTSGLGFLNSHGYWVVNLTRNKLLTIVIANDDALQQSFDAAEAKANASLERADREKADQFRFYNRIVLFCLNDAAYRDWPRDLALVPVSLEQRMAAMEVGNSGVDRMDVREAMEARDEDMEREDMEGVEGATET